MTPPVELAVVISTGLNPPCSAAIFCIDPNMTLLAVSLPVSATPSHPSIAAKKGYITPVLVNARPSTASIPLYLVTNPIARTIAIVSSGIHTREAVRTTAFFHIARFMRDTSPAKIAAMKMPVPAAPSHLNSYTALSMAVDFTTGGVRITTPCTLGTSQFTTAPGTASRRDLTGPQPQRKTRRTSMAQGSQAMRTDLPAGELEAGGVEHPTFNIEL